MEKYNKKKKKKKPRRERRALSLDWKGLYVHVD